VKAKQILSDFFWFPITSKSKIEVYQERIRQLEWNAVKTFLKVDSTFLDVGCGAGYSLMKAYQEFHCQVQGIDPEPGAHGVGRFTENLWKERPIIQGNAENLPFEDDTFDIVYSSHVLEHVTNEDEALREMKRVLKPNGILIIGMPTAAMSWVALFSSWFFTTHISIYHFIRSAFKKDVFTRFIRIFLPGSHSSPRAKHITYDLIHYRIKQWKKIVSKRFVINKVITPGLYPYPDYIQWFPFIKKGRLSSSVFFICSKE
jgi:ubiquinone/menaquinone biosynthesis C-methylase UbiE